MKKIFPLFLSLVFFGVPFVSAHADISTGLVGWWKFDEGAGTNDVDSSGAANTGTSVGSPSYVTGEIGPYALQFNGSSQYVNVPNNSSLNPASVTVSAWIYPTTSIITGTTRIAPVEKWYSGGVWGYGIETNDELSNDISFRFRNTADTSDRDLASNVQAVAGKWYFVTATYNSSTGVASIYINGVLSNTLTDTANPLMAPASPLVIGASDDNGTYQYYFPGTIDDVHIYNRALSASDVLQLYNYADLSANEMTSPSYTITINSINFGGDYSTSTSYSEQDTIGEIATGNSSSTNYAIGAGYQQMYTSYISVGALTPVNLGHINGVTGGTATGTLAITVTTDNPAGYSLSVQASSSPAMQTATGSYFSDYSSVSSTTPDYAFAIASNTSAFGFSVNSADALEKYLNNGSACNIGSTDTAFTCWNGFSTSPAIVAQSAFPNNATGTVTTLDLEAEVGNGKLQDAGTYTATITVTAVTL